MVPPRELTDPIAALLLPPGLPLLLIALGALLAWRRRRRAGAVLGVTGFVLLWIFSLGSVGLALARLLEPPPASPAAFQGAGAIVVLGAGRIVDSPEYGEDTVGGESLTRLRYGARLARQTGLPLLVVGGKPYGGRLTEGETMANALKEDFRSPARWIEGDSRTTAENAVRAFELLSKEGHKRILLVTSAVHMRRAELAFRKAGFDVVAAPTAFRAHRDLAAIDWVPTADGLTLTRAALWEIVGLFWYRLRGVA